MGKREFEHFDFRVKEFKSADLYVNTTGYAYLKFWASGRVKVFIPNVKGYILIKNKRINFKRLLYSTVYSMSLKNKVIVKLGKTCNILNLYCLSETDYQKWRKNKTKIKKNTNTGVCEFLI